MLPITTLTQFQKRENLKSFFAFYKTPTEEEQVAELECLKGVEGKKE